jgi:DNA-binding NarL/FixJ family response regulator
MSQSMRESPSLRRRRVLIVDDHPVVRSGLKDLITAEGDLEVCGEASDMNEAMRQVADSPPEAVVLDLSLKDSHGMGLIEQIRGRDERIKILVWSGHDETLFAERVLRAGAMGYLNKREPPERVLEGLRQVLNGDICLSPQMANRLLRGIAGTQDLSRDPIASLSNRELEIFQLIGQGMNTKQIARRLQLSPKTVETHRENVKKKLGVTSSAELTRHAVQWVLQMAPSGAASSPPSG